MIAHQKYQQDSLLNSCILHSHYLTWVLQTSDSLLNHVQRSLSKTSVVITTLYLLHYADYIYIYLCFALNNRSNMWHFYQS